MSTTYNSLKIKESKINVTLRKDTNTPPETDCNARRGQRKMFTLHIIWFFSFGSNSNSFDSIALLYYCLCTQFRPHLKNMSYCGACVSVYSKLISVRVLCYQPSCQNRFEFTIILKPVVAKILFKRYKDSNISRQRIRLI